MKLLLLLLLFPLIGGAEDTYNPNAGFIRSFNIWAAQVRSISAPHTINAAEIQEWMEVKVEWEILKRHVDDHYKGTQ